MALVAQNNTKSVMQDLERRNSISLWSQTIEEEMSPDASNSNLVMKSEPAVQKNETDNVVLIEQIIAEDQLHPKSATSNSKYGASTPQNETSKQLLSQRRPSMMNRRGSNSLRIRRSSKDLSNSTNHENASFEDMIPLPHVPRFTTAMSLEAQYAIMMGYEDRIRRRLAVTFPEYSNLLRRTLSPKSAGRPLQLYSSLLKSDLQDHDVKSKSKNSTMILQQTQSIDHEISDISLDQKLILSRRLKLAHCLLDAMDINRGLPALTPSQFLLSHNDGFNPVQRYNWWSGSWGHDFGIKPPQQRQTNYHKLLPPQELQLPLFIVE